MEICHLQIWSTLCSSAWDRNGGMVVCHQLGLEFLQIPTRYKYGKGTGQIWLGNLSCTGSESRLTDCPHYEFSSNDCYSSQVANVICTSKHYK